MSNIAMQRQIYRLKTDIDQIKPRTPVKYQLMGVPPDDASDEAKAAYQAEFDAAQAAGVFVIQLVPVRSPNHGKPKSQAPDRPHQD